MRSPANRLATCRRVCKGAAARWAAIAAASLAIALMGAAAGAGGAEARGLKLGFADDPLFQFSGPSTRATWLDRAVGARADMVRIGAYWSSLAGSQPPANPTDPADPDLQLLPARRCGRRRKRSAPERDVHRLGRSGLGGGKASAE